MEDTTEIGGLIVDRGSSHTGSAAGWSAARSETCCRPRRGPTRRSRPRCSRPESPPRPPAAGPVPTATAARQRPRAGRVPAPCPSALHGGMHGGDGGRRFTCVPGGRRGWAQSCSVVLGGSARGGSRPIVTRMTFGPPPPPPPLLWAPSPLWAQRGAGGRGEDSGRRSSTACWTAGSSWRRRRRHANLMPGRRHQNCPAIPAGLCPPRPSPPLLPCSCHVQGCVCPLSS